MQMCLIGMWILSSTLSSNIPSPGSSLNLQATALKELYWPPELFNQPPKVCKIGSPDCFPKYIEGHPDGGINTSRLSWECLEKIPTLVEDVVIKERPKDWLLIRGPQKAGKFQEEKLFYLGIYAYNYQLGKYERVGLVPEGTASIYQCPIVDNVNGDGYLDIVSRLFQPYVFLKWVIRSFPQGKELLLTPEPKGADELADINGDNVKEFITFMTAYMDTFKIEPPPEKGPECKMPPLPPRECFYLSFPEHWKEVGSFQVRLELAIFFYSKKEKKFKKTPDMVFPYYILPEISKQYIR